MASGMAWDHGIKSDLGRYGSRSTFVGFVAGVEVARRRHHAQRWRVLRHGLRKRARDAKRHRRDVGGGDVGGAERDVDLRRSRRGRPQQLRTRRGGAALLERTRTARVDQRRRVGGGRGGRAIPRASEPAADVRPEERADSLVAVYDVT